MSDIPNPSILWVIYDIWREEWEAKRKAEAKKMSDAKFDPKGRNKVKYACNAHNGEHPFFYKIGVNGFVTYCGEVWDNSKKYPKRK